jgi:hypothetical protein
MSGYQPSSRRPDVRAFALALVLAIAGAALTVWLSVTGGRALMEVTARDDVQLSPIPGLLFVVASVFLLPSSSTDQQVPPKSRRALALFFTLMGLGFLAMPLVTAS